MNNLRTCMQVFAMAEAAASLTSQTIPQPTETKFDAYPMPA